ncbi:MAG: hypothetical protein ACTH6A_06605 [Brachybacterium tyrofermentans]|uniref:hypothetical protein n=1 Tax=Brachybacterium tyrofermentans TaxID=47848 RepID=UPI003F8DB060
MSEYVVIHGAHGGDWGLIFDPRGADYSRLFRPGDWHAPYRSIGLSYSIGSGIDLARNPRRAHRQARRIVNAEERGHRRRIRRAVRQRAAIDRVNAALAEGGEQS